MSPRSVSLANSVGRRVLPVSLALLCPSTKRQSGFLDRPRIRLRVLQPGRFTRNCALGSRARTRCSCCADNGRGERRGQRIRASGYRREPRQGGGSFVESAREFIRLGADVILPMGVTQCSVHIKPDWLMRELGVSVVEGIGAPIRFAAMLVSLKLNYSRKYWPKSPERGSRRTRSRRRSQSSIPRAICFIWTARIPDRRTAWRSLRHGAYCRVLRAPELGAPGPRQGAAGVAEFSQCAADAWRRAAFLQGRPCGRTGRLGHRPERRAGRASRGRCHGKHCPVGRSSDAMNRRKWGIVLRKAERRGTVRR